MKRLLKNCIGIVLAGVAAFPLCACASETAETAFDSPLPWHDGTDSYEKLEYDVAVYDTTGGTQSDKRVKIASGDLSYTLEEISGYINLSSEYSVTYNAAAPQADAEKTDRISSRAEVEMNSMAVKSSSKTVELADRPDTENLSYSIEADYFGAHKAVMTTRNGEKSLKLPTNATRDNEMMFYTARAVKIGKGSSSNFKMVNLFESFAAGKLKTYTMVVSGAESVVKMDVGDWVKDFGVADANQKDDAGSAEPAEPDYSVPCYAASIMINSEKHGPPYMVMYSENPFVHNGKSHAKIPVCINYSVYNGSKPYRYFEYNLKSLSFEKNA